LDEVALLYGTIDIGFAIALALWRVGVRHHASTGSSPRSSRRGRGELKSIHTWTSLAVCHRLRATPAARARARHANIRDLSRRALAPTLHKGPLVKKHLALLVLLVSVDAHAQSVQDAHVLFGTDLSFSANRTSVKDSPADNFFATRLGADVLVTGHLTLGGTLGASGEFAGSSWEVGFDAAARVGWLAPIAERSAIWPQLSLGFEVTSEPACTLDAGGNATCVRTVAESVGVSLFVPIIFTPLPHLFIGIGPTFERGLWSSEGEAAPQSIGLQTVLGGFF
jgi:hypothetical protein